jgi:hypothetical protein
MLQREYLENLQAKPPAPVKVDISFEYKDIVDIFWIYLRRNLRLLCPVPYIYKLNWKEINQIKYGNNTYHFGK